MNPASPLKIKVVYHGLDSFLTYCLQAFGPIWEIILLVGKCLSATDGASLFSCDDVWSEEIWND